MKIVVSGGSGFIGSPLVARLRERGDDVVVLSRDPNRGLEWHPPHGGPWESQVREADAVVNLAGESIAGGRWTESRKATLTSSRLDPLRALVNAKPRTLIEASAVGYYGYTSDETFDETAARGTGFLAELVEKWEAAAREAEASARVVLLRFGVVLDKHGGALKKMLPPFYLGVGGPIGSGKQWMSWVDREDIIRAIEWAIDNATARGIYNVAAPNPVRNREFSRALGRTVHRPAFMPVPGFALRTLFGRGLADEALLGGQRAVPSRLQREGFTFKYPTLEASLLHIFQSR
ncbi:MAG TPA: TIGR01777 family oxidoreductase [Thermoanaerobaculia bacterium]